MFHTVGLKLKTESVTKPEVLPLRDILHNNISIKEIVHQWFGKTPLCLHTENTTFLASNPQDEDVRVSSKSEAILTLHKITFFRLESVKTQSKMQLVVTLNNSFRQIRNYAMNKKWKYNQYREMVPISIPLTRSSQVWLWTIHSTHMIFKAIRDNLTSFVLVQHDIALATKVSTTY